MTEELKCSFCLKLKSEVKVLVKSPLIKGKVSYICDECVADAKIIMKELPADIVS